jgi:Uncharacterized protein conserved in bacteria (DUF2188)
VETYRRKMARMPVERLRVLPAHRGGWRVESARGTQAVCETPREAEAVAERLVHEAGGGEILVFDAYLRLRHNAVR